MPENSLTCIKSLIRYRLKCQRICLQDLLGRSGAFREDRITFDAAAYGVQCIYLEKESGNE